jgi:DNA repair and recombination protein RAD52
MPFSQTQLDALNAPLSRGVVKERKQAGRTFSYVEGWHVIAEANRIFGHDGWTSDTIEVHCVVEKDRLIGKELLPGWGVTYTAKVRIGVYFDDGSNVYREGYGAGHGIDQDLGQAHESAIKEAETDARKRALMTFGNPFGLALYDKAQSNVASEVDVSRLRFIEECKAKIAAFDETDRDGISRWWHSDEQRKARRDFEINPAELAELKNLVAVKAKLPPSGAAP